MIYLFYMLDGFVKKFPLLKSQLSIGRTDKNDLTIENPSISRSHLSIEVGLESIIIKDLNSINGSFFKEKRIKNAEVHIGESFFLGELEFTLQTISSDEFSKSESFIPEFNKNTNIKDVIKYLKTDQLKDAYGNLLEEFLNIGIKSKNFNEALIYLSKNLSNLPNFGSLFIVSNDSKNPLILFSYKKNEKDFLLLKEIITDKKTIDLKKPKFEIIISKKGKFSTLPLKLNNIDGTLMYFYNTNDKETNNELEKFISILAKEIELLSGLYPGNSNSINTSEKKKIVETNIIAENGKMKILISQAIKIAKSDIFVLIQGESGTGKELFARLIHNYSTRYKKDFVALNCAAIPENLLESELFGHEKGAFTGAYVLKKGKLEIASGGTLILDEIGDMPYNLQTKLLRALQEHEFYRLGGIVPIKVDLRIISITNCNLKELIEKKKFREDLYYRLVHRSLLIPPLRERREDIPVLINYFTNKFCKESDRTVSGYSIKAFETLQNYSWQGNIRQLENEIKSIVNLTDEGEMIDSEILSNEITQNININEVNGTDETYETNVFYQKPDKETILKVLIKHNWHKTKAAKELNMTYRGLHKKLEKLNIKNPK